MAEKTKDELARIYVKAHKRRTKLPEQIPLHQYLQAINCAYRDGYDKKDMAKDLGKLINTSDYNKDDVYVFHIPETFNPLHDKLDMHNIQLGEDMSNGLYVKARCVKSDYGERCVHCDIYKDNKKFVFEYNGWKLSGNDIKYHSFYSDETITAEITDPQGDKLSAKLFDTRRSFNTYNWEDIITLIFKRFSKIAKSKHTIHDVFVDQTIHLIKAELAKDRQCYTKHYTDYRGMVTEMSKHFNYMQKHYNAHGLKLPVETVKDVEELKARFRVK